MYKTRVRVVEYALLGKKELADVTIHVGLQFTAMEGREKGRDVECHLQGAPLTEIVVEPAGTHDKKNNTKPKVHVLSSKLVEEGGELYVEKSIDDLVAYCRENFGNEIYKLGTKDCWHMVMSFCEEYDLDIPEVLTTGMKAFLRDVAGGITTGLGNFAKDLFELDDEEAEQAVRKLSSVMSSSKKKETPPSSSPATHVAESQLGSAAAATYAPRRVSDPPSLQHRQVTLAQPPAAVAVVGGKCSATANCKGEIKAQYTSTYGCGCMKGMDFMPACMVSTFTLCLCPVLFCQETKRTLVCSKCKVEYP